jgi:hypothetical protein
VVLAGKDDKNSLQNANEISMGKENSCLLHWNEAPLMTRLFDAETILSGNAWTNQCIWMWYARKFFA